MDTEQFITQLLTAAREGERQAMLIKWAIEGRLDILFFGQLKQRAVDIRGNDRLQQQKLSAIVEMALALTEDVACQAMGLWARSVTAIHRELWDDAISATAEAMAQYNALGDLASYGTLAANQIFILDAIGKLSEADDLAAEAEKTLLPFGASPALGRIYRHWALVKIDQQQPQEALRLMNLARPFIWDAGIDWRKAAFLIDIAPIYLQLDRYVEAAQCLQEARTFFASDPERRNDWAITANHLAGLYQQMGRLGEALFMADEAVFIHRQMGSTDLTYARAVMRQVTILLDLKQYHSALRQLALIEPLLQADVEKTAHSALLKALALMGVGQMAQADVVLAWFMKVYATRVPLWAVVARFMRAQLYLLWGRLDDHTPYLMQAKEMAVVLFQELDNQYPVRAAEAALLLAECCLILNQPREAVTWLQRLGQKVEDTPHLQTKKERLWGDLAQRSGNELLARQHYERALEATQQLRAQFHLEPYQVGVMNDAAQLYQAILTVCIAQKDWSAVWHYSEAARAYSLTTGLTQETILADTEIAPAMRNRLYEIKARRFQLCSQLYGEMESPQKPSLISPAQEAGQRQAIRQLDEELQTFYQRHPESMPLALNHYAPTLAISVEQMGSRLPNDTVLLVYAHLRDQPFVMALDRQGLVLREILPASWKEIERFAAAFLHFGPRYMMGLSPSEVEAQLADLLHQAQTQLHHLYQALWEPLADRLSRYHHVIIIPQDVLHYFPFHALYTGKEYLLDKHVISYAPSASVYLTCQQRAEVRQGQWGSEVVLLGYAGQRGDLSHVAEEIQQIKLIYPEAQILTGQAATAEQLRQHASVARLLHLATHGRMLSSSPFLAYLELAAADNTPTPHYFRVYDAAQLDLRHTDLVCLSACETGQVADRGGDLLGLQWGFFHAGAYALLANLWPVEDQTAAAFMADFYRRYQPQTGKAIALQQTQQAMRQRGEQAHHAREQYLAHPYFWAPFAVYGFTHPLLLHSAPPAIS